MDLGMAGAPGGAAQLEAGLDGPRGDPPSGASGARQAAEVAARRRGSRKRGAGGPVIVRAHRVNYARRQQYRRLSRAGEAGVGAAGTALLGLSAASMSAALVAVCLLVVAAALGLCARHWLSLARRSRVGPALRMPSRARWHRCRRRAGGCVTRCRGTVGETSTRWRSRPADRHRDRDQDQYVRRSSSRSGERAGGLAVAPPATIGTQRRPCRHVRRPCAGRRACRG
jgi:hypothetical protein